MLLGCSGGPSVGPPGKKDGLKVCWWSSGWTTWQRSLLPSGPSLSPFRQGGAAQDARVRLMEEFSFHLAQKTAKTLPMEPNSFHQAHPPLFLPQGAFALILRPAAPAPFPPTGSPPFSHHEPLFSGQSPPPLSFRASGASREIFWQWLFENTSYLCYSTRNQDYGTNQVYSPGV